MPDLSDLDSLMNRLIVQALIGEPGLSQKTRLYRRNFIRLVDRALREYREARELILAEIAEMNRSPEEMSRDGRRIYLFTFPDHIETCINAVRRLYKLLGRIKAEKGSPRDEVREAETEGIKMEYLAAPVKIIRKDGVIQGIECVRTELAEPDKSWRRGPVPLKGSEFVPDTSSVISAIGQQPDLSWNQEGIPFYFSLRNTFIVNDDCLTNIESVFATGDAVSGPGTVVEAMASGKKVARAVDSYLSGKE